MWYKRGMRSIKKDTEIEYTIFGNPEVLATVKAVFTTITGRTMYEETNSKNPYISFVLEHGDDKIEAAMMSVCDLLKCKVHYFSSDFRKNIYRKHGSHYNNLKYALVYGCGVEFLSSVAKVKEWFAIEKLFSRETARKLKTPEEIVSFVKRNKKWMPHFTGKVGVFEIEAE